MRPGDRLFAHAKGGRGSAGANVQTSVRSCEVEIRKFLLARAHPGYTGDRVTISADQSLWLATAAPTDYGRLERDVETDVAVLGGGITGLTTALMLKRDGARVVVLEGQRIGSGVTGCTTAKVTALQQTVYRQLRRRHGSDGAATYAEASMAGVELVAALAAEEGIECDLERRPAFTYAAGSGERSTVESEHDAASAAGLPVSLVEEVDLPYPTHGAVRLDQQIQLHPVRYVQGLARAVDGDGSNVFEGSAALAVDSDDPCRIRTDGGTVRARQVVVATHYPLLDRGLFFARLEPTRSYCIAARTPEPPPRGMSISAGETTRSVRSHGEALIVGGEGHVTGARKATPERYHQLEEFARRHWNATEITHRWSAQDPVSWDLLPVIGRYHPGSSRLFVASGFHKWGLSSATFGASIIADLIAGRDNRWAKRFSPSRIGARGLPKLIEMNARVAADLLGDRVIPALRGRAAQVPAGDARVIRDGLGKTGVFRDDDGTLHAVSLRCTHLGCLLRFNGAERSWDCPCHGSRFDVDGAVLEGPATKPLERKEI
jgi:glycine/D-amino acid oxidase-like deaminating enzyme/nitrite reductase/ring-hydroxylating ferredoxin subunit